MVSIVQMLIAAPTTHTALKITAPATSIIAVTASFAGVQPIPRLATAMPRTRTPCASLPTRRSANSSVIIWNSGPSGRVSSRSKVPVRTRNDSDSTWLMKMSARLNDTLVAP